MNDASTGYTVGKKTYEQDPRDEKYWAAEHTGATIRGDGKLIPGVLCSTVADIANLSVTTQATATMGRLGNATGMTTSMSMRLVSASGLPDQMHGKFKGYTTLGEVIGPFTPGHTTGVAVRTVLFWTIVWPPMAVNGEVYMDVTKFSDWTNGLGKITRLMLAIMRHLNGMEGFIITLTHPTVISARTMPGRRIVSPFIEQAAGTWTCPRTLSGYFLYLNVFIPTSRTLFAGPPRVEEKLGFHIIHGIIGSFISLPIMPPDLGHSQPPTRKVLRDAERTRSSDWRTARNGTAASLGALYLPPTDGNWSSSCAAALRSRGRARAAASEVAPVRLNRRDGGSCVRGNARTPPPILERVNGVVMSMVIGGTALLELWSSLPQGLSWSNSFA